MREAAFVSLFTLPQNATMWQRIAMNTWNDTSDRVPMFIHSYIRAVSESRNPHYIHKINIARHVLPLTKQYRLIPLTSAYWSVSDYSISQDFGYQCELVDAVRHSTDSPSVIKAKFLLIRGGTKIPILDFSAIGRSMEPDLLQRLKTLFYGTMGPEFTNSHQYRQAVAYLENLKDSELLNHITLFNNIEMFIPATKEYMQELLNSEQSDLAILFRKLIHNEHVHSLMHTNLVDASEFMPSDIGVPITVEIYIPLFASQQIDSNVTKDAQSNKTKIEGKSVTKLVFGNEVSVSMLVPWTNQTISVKLYSETSFNMPVEFSTELDVTKTDVKVLDYSVQLISEQQKPVS